MSKISFIILSLLYLNCQAQQATTTSRAQVATGSQAQAIKSRSTQTANANLEEAKKAIAASNELFFQAFVKGDSSLFIDRYTKDCWIMAPNAQALCEIGRASCRERV